LGRSCPARRPRPYPPTCAARPIHELSSHRVRICGAGAGRLPRLVAAPAARPHPEEGL